MAKLDNHRCIPVWLMKCRRHVVSSLRNAFSKGTWPAWPCLAAITASVAFGAATKPNIVFLYTDDQAAWTIGALGNRQSRTPNIDRLYREGVTLANAFTTTPVCSPSRASLFASRYGTELGIKDYLDPNREPDKGLDPAVPTWPKILQRAGYATSFVGKWHLGSLDRFLPTRNGYDWFYGFRSGAGISKDPAVESAGGTRIVNGYTPDILTAEAIRLIRERDKRKPFLINVHYWAPHANTAKRTPDGDRTWLPLSDTDWKPFRDIDPILPRPDYPKLDVPRNKRMMREYLGAVASVDRNVGRILEVLDELDIAGNTIVVFSSDHGYNLGHHGIWHKGNGRWLLTDNQGPRANMYDGSLRVPAVVRWPDRLAAAAKVDEIVLNIDWFPTLLAMADVGMPPDVMIRGKSFLPLLEGNPIQWRTEFYGEYDQKHVEQVDQRMWRTPEWKLIRNSRDGMDELYHLSEDPQEQRNLINDPDPDVRKAISRLDRALRGKMKEIEGS
ncbi:MAG: sulfatase-like hydrolase/transferase [Acidobacteria bacterium]|nr:sulfatase-like hydrolase/transferase [Acidobacteriota bacterium]